MWTIQFLGKRSNHPNLKKILDKIGKENKPMSDEQMLERIKQLNAMFGGEIKQ